MIYIFLNENKLKINLNFFVIIFRVVTISLDIILGLQAMIKIHFCVDIWEAMSGQITRKRRGGKEGGQIMCPLAVHNRCTSVISSLLANLVERQSSLAIFTCFTLSTQ